MNIPIICTWTVFIFFLISFLFFYYLVPKWQNCFPTEPNELLMQGVYSDQRTEQIVKVSGLHPMIMCSGCTARCRYCFRLISWFYLHIEFVLYIKNSSGIASANGHPNKINQIFHHLKLFKNAFTCLHLHSIPRITNNLLGNKNTS